jgi:hypothetical protein
MEPEALLEKVRQAFQEGKLIIIHELDTFLDRAHPEYVAELNAYLMGEDLNMNRPAKPGFTLWATGNGGTYTGRMALPDSLRTRMSCFQVEQFTAQECQEIIHKRFPALSSEHYQSLVDKHVAQPQEYTFREMMNDLHERCPVAVQNKSNEPTSATLLFTRIIPDYTEQRRKPDDKPKSR